MSLSDIIFTQMYINVIHECHKVYYCCMYCCFILSFSYSCSHNMSWGWSSPERLSGPWSLWERGERGLWSPLSSRLLAAGPEHPHLSAERHLGGRGAYLSRWHYGEVIVWKRLLHYWSVMTGIQRPPVDSLHKGLIIWSFDAVSLNELFTYDLIASS